MAAEIKIIFWVFNDNIELNERYYYSPGLSWWIFISFIVHELKYLFD